MSINDYFKIDKEKEEDKILSGGDKSNIGSYFRVETPVTQPSMIETDSRLDRFGLPKAYLSKPSGDYITPPEEKKKENIWIRSAQAILPKKVEDFFGISPEKLEEKRKKEEFTHRYEEAYAQSDITRLQKQLEANEGKLPVKTASDVFKETRLEDYTPIVYVKELVETAELYKSAKRIERGEETLVDVYRLMKAQAEAEQDSTFWAEVSNVLVDLIPFAMSMGLSAGAYGFGRNITTKAVESTFKKALGTKAGTLATKIAGGIVGGTIQTPFARAVPIATGTLRNMMPEIQFSKNELNQIQAMVTEEGEDLGKAFIKSLSSEWVEVVSEHSGAIFDEMFAPIKNQLMKIGIIKTFLKSNTGASVSMFNEWLRKVGWNGVLQEMGEERIGEIMHGILYKFGLSNEKWEVPTKEQLAVELVAFSIPGVMFETSRAILRGAEGSLESAITSDPSSQKLSTALTETTDQSITTVQEVVGGRDILSVAKGKGALNLNTEVATALHQKLDKYHNEMSETPLVITGDSGELLGEIRVVEYPDGKWGYAYSINTEENGVVSDFLSNKLTNSSEEAIGLAKSQMLEFSKEAVKDITGDYLEDFKNIIKSLEQFEPSITSKVEVKKTSKEIYQEKENELVKIIKEKLALGDRDFIEKMKDRVKDSKEHLAAFNEALKIAEKSLEEAKKTPKKSTEVKVLTAKDVARNLIESYVLRGDSLKSLKDGQMGSSSSQDSSQIGGYLDGKRISNDKIIVSKVEGKDLDVPEIFSLKEIYDEIIKEKEQTKEKKETKEEPKKEEKETKEKKKEEKKETKKEEVKEEVKEEEKYKAKRAIPSDRAYSKSSDKFIVGKYKGKTYTSNSFILEFDSDVEKPKKMEEQKGEDAPSEKAVDQIIPNKKELEKVEVSKVIEADKETGTYVELEGESVTMKVSQLYYDYFNKKYPKAEYKAASSTKPVVVYENNKMVGLISPLIISDKNVKNYKVLWQRGVEVGEIKEEAKKPTPRFAKPKEAKTETEIENYIKDNKTKFRVEKTEALIIPDTATKERGLTSKFFEDSNIKGREFASYEYLYNLSNSTGLGLKLAEKEIIQGVLEKHKDQKKINLNDFKNEAIGNMLQISVINSDTYASYGSENIGNYPIKATTYILNTDFEHGRTGHFTGDFTEILKVSELEIREIPISEKNPTTKYAVVKKGITLTEENIERNVFNVANSKAQAEAWISNHTFGDIESGEVQVHKPGLFAHFRTFDEVGGITMVAEIQSDIYQNLDSLELTNSERKKLEEKIMGGKELIEEMEKEISHIEAEEYYKKKGYNTLEEFKKSTYYLDHSQQLDIYKRKLAEKEAELGGLKIKEVPNIEKRFLDYKGIWQERVIREAIQIKAKEGFNEIWFPTPRTIAVIEGYASGESADVIPYFFEGDRETELQVGDEIEYLDTNMTVVEADYESIKVAPTENVIHFDEETEREKGVQSQWDDLVYDFENLEKDFGKIDNAEKAGEVVSLIETYNEQIAFKNKELDIKREKEYLKEKTDPVNLRIEEFKNAIENYNKLANLIKSDFLEKEKMSLEKINSHEYKESLKKKYGIDFSFWNIVISVYDSEVYNYGDTTIDYSTAKEITTNEINRALDRTKEKLREEQVVKETLEKETKERIKEIEKRKSPTKKLLDKLPEKLQKELEVQKTSHYDQYYIDFNTEKILEKMLEEETDKTISLEDIEYDVKELLYEYYEPGFEDAYGSSNVFYQDTVYDNQEVWIVTEGDVESLGQPDQYEEVSTIENFNIENYGEIEKTVLNFYDKQVIKYLKKYRKENLKLIEDNNGYEWWSTEVTPEDTKDIVAYRLKDSMAREGFEITEEQEKEIRTLNKNIFGDDKVEITSQAISNNEALGSYREGVIRILNGQADPKGTFYHEAVHKYLDIFTTQEEYAEILKEAKEKYNIKDLTQVEEKLAEDVIKYAKSREGFFGRLKLLIDNFIQRVKSFLGSESKINKLYIDIVSGEMGRLKKDLMKDYIEFSTPVEEAEAIFRKLFSEKEMKFAVDSTLWEEGISGQWIPSRSNYRTMDGISMVELAERNGKVREKTIYHEAFHGFFNTYLTSKERRLAIDTVKNSWITKPAMRLLYDTDTYRTEDMIAEEWLANDFANYVAQKKNIRFTGLKGIFEKLSINLRELVRKYGKLQMIYDDILERTRNGEYSTDETTLRYSKLRNKIETATLGKDKPEVVERLLKEIRSLDQSKMPIGIASVGSDMLGNFELLEAIPNKTEGEFKIYEEVKSLVEKYAKTIGEDYLPRRALGVYYPETTNVRIKGMNNLSVAAHEITHFLDDANKITKKLMKIERFSKDGKPIYDRSTANLRRELTNLYEEYYPGGRRTHKLVTRMMEGFAMLLEKYTEQPSTITAKYPNLVNTFLKEGGGFYEPIMGDIVKDLRNIVANYQSLEALDKIGSRVVNDKVDVNKDSFLNFAEKIKTQIADEIYPEEVLAKKAGVHFTPDDPSLWLRQFKSSSAMIMNNIYGGEYNLIKTAIEQKLVWRSKGYWGWRDGNPVKLHDFNWQDIVKELRNNKETSEFGYYLVARNEYFLFQELKKAKEAVNSILERIEQIGGLKEAEKMTSSTTGKSLLSELKEAKEYYDKINSILLADGFTEKEITEAYIQNKDKFKEIEKKYDALVREDLAFLNDPQVGLVDNETFKRLTSKEGYASLKRFFYDEVTGDPELGEVKNIRFGKTKVSSLLRRKGSQKPIINPLLSAIKNHAEITRKGLKQIVYNKNVMIGLNNPELGIFQRLQLQTDKDKYGNTIYPQERDPDIIMGRINYKRVPVLVNSTIKNTIDNVMTYQNMGLFEQIFTRASRIFSKGTTSAFVGFTFSNIPIDTVTMAAQTRNKAIPIFSGLKEFTKVLNTNNPNHLYLLEYLAMGGQRQTLVGWQNMTPNELFKALNNEKAGILKVLDAIDAGADVVGLPAQWSEIFSRATEYILARKSGKPPIVALEEAGRVTAPFHHIGKLGKGRLGKTIVKSIPYFNANIQVLAQFGETLTTREGRIRYAYTTAAVVAASLAAIGVLIANGSDDQKRQYSDIPPGMLGLYIWYPLPGGKGLGKIRVPEQINWLATLVNMIWTNKALQSNYKPGEYLEAVTAWLPQQANIIQPIEMFMGWIPQIFKPGVLTVAGVKDFPRVMPLEGASQSYKEPRFRYTESTSVVAKWLGDKFNLSPIKIDTLVTGYVGRASGYLMGKPGVYNPFSVLKSDYFIGGGRKMQDFYEEKKKNDELYNSYKNRRRTFKVGERSAILRDRAKLKIISDTISLYYEADEEKNPSKALHLRNKILDQINRYFSEKKGRN